MSVVTVGGLSVSGQYFSPVTTLSSSFSGDPIDGILGLAWPAISNLGHDPFFFTAVDQGVVDQGVFGFKLASSGSELFIGGTNENLYTGDIEYHDLSSSNGFWQIGGASVTVNGKTEGSDFDTIIDSGSTIITAPTSTAKKLWSAVSGSKVYDSLQSFYSHPCDSMPEIKFN